MQNRSLFKFLIFTALTLFVGCGESVENPQTEAKNTDNETSNDPLNPNAEPAELNEQVFIDVETFEKYRKEGALVMDVRDQETYEKNHIPGAVRSSWSDFKAEDREGAFIERDERKLQEAARELGIDRDQKILIYGSAPTTLTARQAWSLEYIGHGDVYILDGGISAWKQNADASLTTEVPEVERGSFKVSTRESILAGEDEIEAALDGVKPVVLFDARSQSEYEGTDGRDNPRHGHMPGAIHYNWKNVYTQNGTLRPKDEIRSELEQKGLLKDGALVVPYCQGGFRSAVVYSILRWLGRDNVKNYDGSWYQYSRTEEWDVERQ